MPFANSVKKLDLVSNVAAHSHFDQFKKYSINKTSKKAFQSQLEKLLAKMRRLEEISTRFEVYEYYIGFFRFKTAPGFGEKANACFKSVLTALIQAISVHNLEHLTSLVLYPAPAVALTGLQRTSTGFSKLTCLRLIRGSSESNEAPHAQRITAPGRTRHTRSLADFIALAPKLETLAVKSYRIFPDDSGSRYMRQPTTVLPPIKSLDLTHATVTCRQLSALLLQVKSSLRDLIFWSVDIVEGSWQTMFRFFREELNLVQLHFNVLKQGDSQVDFRKISRGPPIIVCLKGGKVVAGSEGVAGDSWKIVYREHEPPTIAGLDGGEVLVGGVVGAGDSWKVVYRETVGRGDITLNGEKGDDIQNSLTRLEEEHVLLFKEDFVDSEEDLEELELEL